MSDAGGGSSSLLTNDQTDAIIEKVETRLEQQSSIPKKGANENNNITNEDQTLPQDSTLAPGDQSKAGDQPLAAESPEKAAAKKELDDAKTALSDMGEESPENKEDPVRIAAVAKVKELTEAYEAMTGGRRRSRRRHVKKSAKKSKKSGARKSKKGGRSRKNGSKRRAQRKH